MKFAIITRWVLATRCPWGLPACYRRTGTNRGRCPRRPQHERIPSPLGTSPWHGESLFTRGIAPRATARREKLTVPWPRTYQEKPSNFTDGHMMGEMTDGGIFWKMSEGRGPMPSFKKLLTDEERWHLVNHLRALAHSHHDESHGQGALLVAGIAQDQQVKSRQS